MNEKYVGISPADDLDDPEGDRREDDQPEPRPAAPGRQQRAGQRADRHDRAEQAVLTGALVEDLGGHQRRGHLEVQAEGADEEDDAS